MDPGLQRTGYGVVRVQAGRLVVCAGGVVRSRSSDPLEQRILELHQGVVEVIEEYRPQTMAVEELFSTYEHPKTAILMAHARGVIFLAAALHGLPVTGYTATQVKRTLTGSGRAGKEQVQAVIRNEFGLNKVPEPNDVADALAVALCHHHMSRTQGHPALNRRRPNPV